MAYRFKRGETVKSGLRRIAHEQIEKAIGEVDDPSLGSDATVHQVRKRCKKLRGLLRLVRPTIGDTYARENAFLRDAARSIATLRDAESVLEAFDRLVEHFSEPVDVSGLQPVRETLLARRERIKAELIDDASRIEDFRKRMTGVLKRSAKWKPSKKEFKALAGGLEKTYARACDAMVAAYENPNTERFHEWRKRVKYHWYHTRLLQNTWREVMTERRRELKSLSDLLGDDHDLAVLRETVTSECFRDESGASSETLQALLGLIDRRRAELQATARPLGERLFLAAPKTFADNVSTYWKAWRRGDEPSCEPSALCEPAVPPEA